MYKLAHREQPTATDIRKELGLDAGYLSRILRDFQRRKFIVRKQSKADETPEISLIDWQGPQSVCTA